MQENRTVFWIAVLVLVAFGVLLWFMTTKASASEEAIWNRYVYLFCGVEAIAFAAAGFLFGKEVHREQAAKAEQRADKEAQQAKDANSQAVAANTAGSLLADVAEGKVSAATAGAGIYQALGGGAGGMADEWKAFAELARQHFPKT